MIRFLQESDIPDIKLIEEESFFEISDMVKDDNEYALGVFDNESHLVGFCSCGCADVFGEEYTVDIALSDLYILEYARGNGYAGELIQRVQEIALERKCRVILDLWNDEVKELYKKYGFKEIEKKSVNIAENTMIWERGY